MGGLKLSHGLLGAEDPVAGSDPGNIAGMVVHADENAHFLAMDLERLK